MSQFNNSSRHQKLYIDDNNGQEVFPLNCVPAASKRPKGSWTKGVMAWEKGSGGSLDICIGWFAPPRRKGKTL